MERDSIFTGTMIIMIGFTLQLVFQVIELIYLTIVPLGHYIMIITFIMLINQIFIIKLEDILLEIYINIKNCKL